MKTFKEFIDQQLSLNEGTPSNFIPPRQIGPNLRQSAVEKIAQAQKDGNLPFDVQYTPGALRIELRLTDEEIEFLKNTNIIQSSGMGAIINKDNFNNAYTQITRKSPIL
jgi:hypothetical protein